MTYRWESYVILYLSGTSEGLEGDHTNPRKRSQAILLLDSDSEDKGELLSTRNCCGSLKKRFNFHQRMWCPFSTLPSVNACLNLREDTFIKCVKGQICQYCILPLRTRISLVSSGSEFPAHADQRLSKIQSSVLSSSGPLIKLWSDLSHQGFNGESDGLIPVKSVLDVCQQTLALVGNASSYINEMRCNDIIDKVKFKCPQIAAFLQDILLTH